MAEVGAILKQRGSIYGDYKTGVVARNEILQTLNLLHMSETGENLNGLHTGYILDIVNKLVRIAVTPNHIDSWTDIAGYATLVKDQLIKERPEDAN